VAPVPRKLIDAGVVNGCLHTLKTAGKWGVEPTGNGFKGSTSSIPMPGSTNVYIEPGPGSIDSALDGERTVELVNLMGIHTADRVTGDFSVGASGFIVEKGLKKRPFRNGTISGNIFELLSKVIKVGDDLIFYGSTGAPSILVESVVVSGS
jgi:PmbA protein